MGSCVSVLTRILVEYVECFHTQKDPWKMVLRNVHWPGVIMGWDQSEDFILKKGRPCQRKKKRFGDVQTIQIRSSRPMFREEVRHVFEKHFLVELWGNVRDGIAGDEPIFLLMSLCPCACVWEKQTDVYKQWGVYEKMHLQLLQECVCVLCSEGEVFGKPLLF